MVTLPGTQAAPVEIGSGTYHWSYAYTDPDAHAPLTIDNTIGEMMRDPEAWKAVTNAIRRVSQGRGFLLNMLGSQPDLPLRQALSWGPLGGGFIAAVEQALAELS